MRAKQNEELQFDKAMSNDQKKVSYMSEGEPEQCADCTRVCPCAVCNPTDASAMHPMYSADLSNNFELLAFVQLIQLKLKIIEKQTE